MEYIKKEVKRHGEREELSLIRISPACNKENEEEAVFEETKGENFAKLLNIINP